MNSGSQSIEATGNAQISTSSCKFIPNLTDEKFMKKWAQADGGSLKTQCVTVNIRTGNASMRTLGDVHREIALKIEEVLTPNSKAPPTLKLAATEAKKAIGEAVEGFRLWRGESSQTLQDQEFGRVHTFLSALASYEAKGEGGLGIFDTPEKREFFTQESIAFQNSSAFAEIIKNAMEGKEIEPQAVLDAFKTTIEKRKAKLPDYNKDMGNNLAAWIDHMKENTRQNPSGPAAQTMSAAAQNAILTTDPQTATTNPPANVPPESPISAVGMTAQNEDVASLLI